MGWGVQGLVSSGALLPMDLGTVSFIDCERKQYGHRMIG